MMLGRKLSRHGFFVFLLLWVSFSPFKGRVRPGSEENNSQPLPSF